jgi:hypothetical protein
VATEPAKIVGSTHFVPAAFVAILTAQSRAATLMNPSLVAGNRRMDIDVQLIKVTWLTTLRNW